MRVLSLGLRKPNSEGVALTLKIELWTCCAAGASVGCSEQTSREWKTLVPGHQSAWARTPSLGSMAEVAVAAVVAAEVAVAHGPQTIRGVVVGGAAGVVVVATLLHLGWTTQTWRGRSWSHW